MKRVKRYKTACRMYIIISLLSSLFPLSLRLMIINFFLHRYIWRELAMRILSFDSISVAVRGCSLPLHCAHCGHSEIIFLEAFVGCQNESLFLSFLAGEADVFSVFLGTFWLERQMCFVLYTVYRG